MALENTNTIDLAFLALDDRENGVDLMLFDHGTTTDEAERFSLLLEKFKSYVAFVMGDDFRQTHSQTKPKDVLIRVLCKNPPSDVMQKIEAVYPHGDRINRIPVAFESLDEFLKESGIQTRAEAQPEPPKKSRWPFRR